MCPTKEGDFPAKVPRPSYQIVVFENKFPSFVPDAPQPEKPGTALTPMAPGSVVYEMMLYTNNHAATLAGLRHRKDN